MTALIVFEKYFTTVIDTILGATFNLDARTRDQIKLVEDMFIGPMKRLTLETIHHKVTKNISDIGDLYECFSEIESLCVPEEKRVDSFITNVTKNIIQEERVRRANSIPDVHRTELGVADVTPQVRQEKESDPTSSAPKVQEKEARVANSTPKMQQEKEACAETPLPNCNKDSEKTNKRGKSGRIVDDVEEESSEYIEETENLSDSVESDQYDFSDGFLVPDEYDTSHLRTRGTKRKREDVSNNAPPNKIAKTGDSTPAKTKVSRPHVSIRDLVAKGYIHVGQKLRYMDNVGEVSQDGLINGKWEFLGKWISQERGYTAPSISGAWTKTVLVPSGTPMEEIRREYLSNGRKSLQKKVTYRT